MYLPSNTIIVLEEPSHSDQMHHQHGHIGRVHKGKALNNAYYYGNNKQL